MINVKPYLNFIIKHKLTQSQFLLLYIMYYRRTNQKEADELSKLYRQAFPTDDNHMIGKNLTMDLVERKFIIPKPDGRLTLDCELGKRFLSAFIDKYTAGNELWELYPPFLNSGGKMMPLTAMDKNEFRDKYWAAITGSLEEHNLVIEDLKYAVEKQLVKMNIKNFLNSEGWLVFRQARLQGVNFTGHSLTVDENTFT